MKSLFFFFFFPPPPGISCGLRLHADGQFPPARTLGSGEVKGLRQDLVALAILLGFRQRLSHVLRRGQPQADYSWRQRNLHDRVLEGRPAWGRRDSNFDFKQSALGETLLQFDPAARVDAGDYRPFPISQDEEFAGTSDVRRSARSHRHQKGTHHVQIALKS